jgi:hypothetical protein
MKRAWFICIGLSRRVRFQCVPAQLSQVLLPPCPTGDLLTWGLEVEGHKLTATDPHGQRIIIGGIQPLALGVDAGELQPIVLQELLAFGLVHILLSLGFREG